MIPRSVVQLATAIAKLVPRPLSKSLFVNTGSESNEAAIKMAKLYTGGFEVVGLGGSWHGVTGNAGSVSFASDRKGYGPGMPGTFVIPEPNAYRCPITPLPRSMRPHLHEGRVRDVRHAIDGRAAPRSSPSR